MDHLQEVRAKVIEAVPEIETYIGMIGDRPTRVQGRAITLADVLRAINVNYNPKLKRDIAIESNGDFLERKHEHRREEYWGFYGNKWNLALPLDEQELEVITFLHKILV